MSLTDVQDLRDLERAVRDRLVDHVEAEGLTPEQVADRTGMFLSGITVLFERRTWSLDVSLRVARGLGLVVLPTVEPIAAT